GTVRSGGEPVGDSTKYGNARLFVQVNVSGIATRAAGAAADAPRVEIDLHDPLALGAEFVRWEVATAVAGALLGIDPFDQPNVQQAKDATQTLLTQFKATGRLPIAAPDRTLASGVALTLSSAAKKSAALDPERFLSLLRDGDYFALLAYVAPGDDALGRALRALRAAVRDKARTATMFGYGPRYLHSTGQLHKGGPNSGVFLLLTAAPPPRRVLLPAPAGVPAGPPPPGRAVLVRHAGPRAGRRRLRRARRPRAARDACAPAETRRRAGHRAGGHVARALGDSLMQLGFIGLGKMGLNMVTRLERGGHDI